MTLSLLWHLICICSTFQHSFPNRMIVAEGPEDKAVIQEAEVALLAPSH